MKILALPRDPNPYQELLYRELRARGHDVRYVGNGPTRSQTLNIVLLPLAFLVARTAGYRILHLHWLFWFVPCWATSRRARRWCRRWFMLCLVLGDILGIRLVWTVHNVLPHRPLFDDDRAARRWLAARCYGIIAMNRHVASRVFDEFAPAQSPVVIPHGNYLDSYSPMPDRAAARAELGLSDAAFIVAFVGRIERYKGVSELLTSVRDLGRVTAVGEAPVDVLVAGRCDDPALRRELEQLAGECAVRVLLWFGQIADDRIPVLLAASTLLTFPFTDISTSGSLLLGMGAGKPCVVPDLPAFDDVPAGALWRYRADDAAGLRAVLSEAVASPDDVLADVGRMAGRFAESLDWGGIAEQHVALFARSRPAAPTRGEGRRLARSR